MADTKIFSASCPDLTVIHEWTAQKLNSDKKTKSLPNMAFVCHELEKKTKNTDVSLTFKIEEHDKKLSASCPNLTVNHEWTIKKLNSDKKTKSLPNMAFICHELKVDTKITGVSKIFKIEKHTEKLSASCPNLMQNHELTLKKLNSDKKTKSLPNMALLYHEVEKKTKNTDVSKTLKIEEHDKKLSASCPNLMQNHELTIKKLNCDKKTKSLPNMILTHSDELKVKKAYDSEKITEIECAKEEIEVPKKKRRTMYKRVKRFFRGLCCCCAKL
ncbi:unnamed protein product [Aphis gossypii]|uniref:Uncharacterized protein n=1 Tax=Aphis gossypii TaxID=80765 RepID=A0A9P0NHJ8_APHGO|nr:unnamed protein product [Aphis gossypii]